MHWVQWLDLPFFLVRAVKHCVLNYCLLVAKYSPAPQLAKIGLKKCRTQTLNTFLDIVSKRSSSWQTAHAWVGGVVWWTSTFIHEGLLFGCLSYLRLYIGISSWWLCSTKKNYVAVHTAYRRLSDKGLCFVQITSFSSYCDAWLALREKSSTGVLNVIGQNNLTEWLLKFQGSMIRCMSVYYEENLDTSNHPSSSSQFSQASLSLKQRASTLICKLMHMHI